MKLAMSICMTNPTTAEWLPTREAITGIMPIAAIMMPKTMPPATPPMIPAISFCDTSVDGRVSVAILVSFDPFQCHPGPSITETGGYNRELAHNSHDCTPHGTRFQDRVY